MDSAPTPLSSGRGNYLPTQSEASNRSASSSPSARCHSSGFDVDNAEADVQSNVAVADGHADIRATTDYKIDDDADEDDFDDTHGEALGVSFRAAPSLDLDLLFGAVDSNVDLHCTPLLSPLSPSPLPSPLLFLLLLLGSPSEIQEFSLSGRAASAVALTPEPPRTTRTQPEFIRTVPKPRFYFIFSG